MTLAARLLALFAPCVMALTFGAFVFGVYARSLPALAASVMIPYLLPLLTFRVIHALAPISEGRSYLDVPRYSAWWASHELQKLFIALPQLESLLQLIPGVYSVWLRMWGSRVGSGVRWTTRVEVTDRSLLDIGSNVVFGHKVILFGHVVRPSRRGLFLYVRRVRIGAGAFISAGCRLGPGVVVEDGAFVPILTDLYVGEHFAARAPAAVSDTKLRVVR